MAITTENSTPKHSQATPAFPPLPPQQPTPTPTPTTTTTMGSDYEQTREQRIRENRERMMKLGIVDLSNQVRAITPLKRTPRSQFDRKTPLKSPSLPPSEPRRRSSRLQDAPLVTYVELKDDKPQRRRDVVIEEGAKPEYYTEEHEKLLGNTEMPWTFFVDGYGSDGKRIYDPVAGKTCHQCRQKTLGQRTRCSQCSLVQGQFCGDCLMTRYGEHVVEANQNPNWICPPCRGICNCSLCRIAKGWAPTGPLFKKISNLGYKSVAHYLIQTKRAPPNEDNVSDTQQSAKRSLPFEGMQVPSDDSSDDKSGDAKTEKSMQSGNDAAADTEASQVPEGVRRSGRKSKNDNDNAGDVAVMKADVVEDAPVSDGKSPRVIVRPRGRPRKMCTKENLVNSVETMGIQMSSNDCSDIKAGDAKTESSMQFEIKSAPDTEANQVPEGVRRSGRKSMKENNSAGDAAVMKADVPENVPVSDNESPGVIARPRGRPRKMCKTENLVNSVGTEGIQIPSDDCSDDKAENAKTENSMQFEKNSAPDTEANQVQESATRSGRKFMKEYDGAGDVTVTKADVVEDVPFSDTKSPRASGRPRKMSKPENIDNGGDTVGTGVNLNEVAVMKADLAEDASVSDKKGPGVTGRPRGRPSKRCKTENLDNCKETVSMDVAETGPIPESIGVY